MIRKYPLLLPILHSLLVLLSTVYCSTPEPEILEQNINGPVKAWITSPNQINLLYAKSLPLSTAKNDRFPVVVVDTTKSYQTVDGFGFTLTGSSAYLIHKMPEAAKKALLHELFGNKEKELNISYLRISIGASDLDSSVFSYNDLPAGQTDPNLLNFDLSRDKVALIPVLQDILAINPKLKLMGSPWSPPTWMKDNGRSIGGSLKKEFYTSYARYLAKYIQAMASHGITIEAITIQNEPQHGGNNPSMLMSAAQQADFIKNHLGPVFESLQLRTKIVIWDHNCDNPQYPISILNDPAAKAYVDGSAFHLYNGDISALSQVKQVHPDRNLYFTEQWTGSNGSFDGDLKWHLKNVIIGSMRNWSKIALEWNLANDPAFSLHTPGGCTQCLGALTLDGAQVVRNVSYYIIAHASAFVPPGAVRIESNLLPELPNVAFKTPDGKIVLIALNEGSAPASFNIQSGKDWIVTTLNPGNVGTYVW